MERVGGTSFAAQVFTCLGRLCAHRPASAPDATETPEVLFGGEAATSVLCELVTKGSGKLTFAEVVGLLPFACLLEAEPRAKLLNMKNEILKKCNIKGDTSQDSKSTKPRQSVVDTRKMVKSIFEN